MRARDLRPACGLAELARRLEAKARPPDARGCRLFRRTNGTTGYGQIGYTDLDGHHHTVGAHRLAYLLAHPEEDVAPREDIRHSCDVRACVEPTHLLRGSRSDNEYDKHARGRGWPRKLADVREEACARYLAGEAIRALARAYGVSQPGMRQALRRWGVYSSDYDPFDRDDDE